MTAKMIYLARRNPALTFEEWPARWRQHAVLASQQTVLGQRFLGVAQCSRTAASASVPEASDAFDGINLLTIPDLAAADLTDDPGGLAVMLEDELKVFSGYVDTFTVLSEEQVLRAEPIDRAKGKVVVIDALRFRGDGGVDDLADTYALHTPEGVLRLAVNTVVGERPPGYDYDAVVETWLRSANDLAGLRDGRDWVRAALVDRVDFERSTTLLTEVTHAYFLPGVLDQPVRPEIHGQADV